MAHSVAQSTYQTRPYSPWRALISDVLQIAKEKNYIHGLYEMDVTEARCRIHEYEAYTGNKFSFTAFLVACIARAVDENKSIHALRQGKRLVIFDDVDVNIQIEREVDGDKVVSAYVVRAANHKSALEIHHEIRAAQNQIISADAPMESFPQWVLLITKLPRFVRLMILRRVLGNPFMVRKLGGTVDITAIGMAGKRGGWGIPIAETSLEVTVGGIEPKSRCVDGQICIREMLSITLSFDHDVMDGSPATRFAMRMRDLIEAGYGLEPVQLQAASQRDS